MVKLVDLWIFSIFSQWDLKLSKIIGKPVPIERLANLFVDFSKLGFSVYFFRHCITCGFLLLHYKGIWGTSFEWTTGATWLAFIESVVALIRCANIPSTTGGIA
jgi:hypothetical protein